MTDSSPDVWSQRLASDFIDGEESAMQTFCTYLNQVFPQNPNELVPAETIVAIFDMLDAEAINRHGPVRDKLRLILQKMGNRPCGDSLNEKRAIASRVEAFLTKWNHRLLPPSNKDEPCIICCKVAGRDRQGSYELRSWRNGKFCSHGSSRKFPSDLDVGDPPPDSRRKSHIHRPDK